MIELWYKQCGNKIAEMTWQTGCTFKESCSKRFYKFTMLKYIEEMNKLCKEAKKE
jgi:hypothetical protein